MYSKSHYLNLKPQIIFTFSLTTKPFPDYFENMCIIYNYVQHLCPEKHAYLVLGYHVSVVTFVDVIFTCDFLIFLNLEVNHHYAVGFIWESCLSCGIMPVNIEQWRKNFGVLMVAHYIQLQNYI